MRVMLCKSTTKVNISTCNTWTTAWPKPTQVGLHCVTGNEGYYTYYSYMEKYICRIIPLCEDTLHISEQFMCPIYKRLLYLSHSKLFAKRYHTADLEPCIEPSRIDCSFPFLFELFPNNFERDNGCLWCVLCPREHSPPVLLPPVSLIEA